MRGDRASVIPALGVVIRKEGFIGLPVIFGFKTSALRIIDSVRRNRLPGGRAIATENSA